MKDKTSVKREAPIIWPLSNLFLFDRLIPAYRIRDEHYKIGKTFRLATDAEIKAGPLAQGEPPYVMSYLGSKLFVWPADDATVLQVEKWLVLLRIVGAVLSIFLLAALGTLVSR